MVVKQADRAFCASEVCEECICAMGMLVTFSWPKICGKIFRSGIRGRNGRHPTPNEFEQLGENWWQARFERRRSRALLVALARPVAISSPQSVSDPSPHFTNPLRAGSQQSSTVIAGAGATARARRSYFLHMTERSKLKVASRGIH
jgi:hypothetical protein